MLRHEFQPGRLIAGLVFAAAGTLYVGDAAGLWDTPWYVIVPLVVGGLCLAAVAAVVAGGIRRRRRARKRLGSGVLDG
ncbi:hypothetical protein [Streptomyces griseochromogenes]|uniref:hypothetical protein n=1 Tax=Streptomyces griseochromogenes TaxID=68214 RepID=UPI0037BBD879